MSIVIDDVFDNVPNGVSFKLSNEIFTRTS